MWLISIKQGEYMFILVEYFWGHETHAQPTLCLLFLNDKGVRCTEAIFSARPHLRWLVTKPLSDPPPNGFPDGQLCS